MKLRARFPQIGAAPADSAAPSPRGLLGRALRATSGRSGAASKPAGEAAPAPVATCEYAPPIEWPSTVAAWRSTTGKPGDPS